MEVTLFDRAGIVISHPSIFKDNQNEICDHKVFLNKHSPNEFFHRMKVLPYKWNNHQTYNFIIIRIFFDIHKIMVLIFLVVKIQFQIFFKYTLS